MANVVAAPISARSQLVTSRIFPSLINTEPSFNITEREYLIAALKEIPCVEQVFDIKNDGMYYYIKGILLSTNEKFCAV